MTELRRSLSLPVLLFYGVGVIVGAGVYSIIGAVAGRAGHGSWLSLLIAAVPAILVALCYARLVAMLPHAGASYIYVREAVPNRPWVAFLTGYAVIVTAAATTATVAIAFGGYLSAFIALPVWIPAVILILACTLVNMAGIRESSWVTILCTSIEVLGLVVIIWAGAATGQLGRGATSLEAGPVITGAALSFFVYTGFEGLANLAEEARRPRRAIPLSMLISLGLTTGLYVLVALAAIALLPPEELAASPAPLADAAASARPWLRQALVWVALFSTANTALITLVVAARTVMAMAREGHLPRVLARTSPKRGAPWPAALMMAGAALAFLPLGGVAVLGSVSSLLLLTVFVAVCIALIILHRRARRSAAGYILPALAIAAILLLVVSFDRAVYLAAAVAIAAGLVLYAATRGRMPGRATARAGRTGEALP